MRSPPSLLSRSLHGIASPQLPPTSEFAPPEAVRQRRSAKVSEALVDTFGRRHRYLRISLTDRCNLRCRYCMPEEGEDTVVPNANPDLLRTEELLRLLTLFVGLGVRKIRLTGGEPTIRSDMKRIVGRLGELSHALPEPLSLGITTNGVRLARLLPTFRQAGLRNINLSLDTLVAAKFPLLARRPQEWHRRVVDVIHEVAGQEEHFTLKLNCVLLRGVNEDEIGDFVNLTKNLPVEVRFLEFMPFDANGWSANRLIPQADIVEAIQKHLRRNLVAPAERLPPDSLHDVANLWKIPGWRGRIGIIASMTDAFCGGCNRIRLTSDGQLRNCLFGEEGFSLRDYVRAGADDDLLTAAIAAGVRAKHAKLGGKRDMHELKERSSLNLRMVALGG